jgi:hypothetical protein
MADPNTLARLAGSLFNAAGDTPFASRPDPRCRMADKRLNTFERYLTL